jgi:hypothetical protein
MVRSQKLVQQLEDIIASPLDARLVWQHIKEEHEQQSNHSNSLTNAVIFIGLRSIVVAATVAPRSQVLTLVQTFGKVKYCCGIKLYQSDFGRSSIPYV